MSAKKGIPLYGTHSHTGYFLNISLHKIDLL